MLDIIKDFYKELLWKPEVNGSFTTEENIFVNAMGGSAFPVDLYNTTVSEKPLTITRDYLLSTQISKSDLFVAQSFSGNTIEVLTAYNEARLRQIPRISITHGGKLADFTKENGDPYIQIPECAQPRLATGYFFRAINKVRELAGHASHSEEAFTEAANFLQNSTAELMEQAQALAEKVEDKVPIIYASPKYKAVAMAIKINFNENTKTQSFFNELPEMNHNEMVGFTNLVMKPLIVFVQDVKIHPQNKLRMEILEKVLKDKIPFHTIELKGKSDLEQVMYGLQLGQYASYFLAEKYGVDPTPVQMVEDFKKLLKEASPE